MDPNPYRPPIDEDAPRPLPQDASTQRLASRGSRFGAAFVDGIIIGVLSTPAYLGDEFDLGVGAIVQAFVLTAYSVIVSCAVQIWFFRSGQSIGKRLAHIRIVEYPSGQTASVLRILALRILPFTLIAIVPWVGWAIVMIDPLFIFGGERRCLHDLIAGTKVVDVERA
jgi:uncharacterized RDD family membrane protein YckC